MARIFALCGVTRPESLVGQNFRSRARRFGLEKESGTERMSVVHLTSYDAFTKPLDYHSQVASFLRQASQELPLHSQEVVSEIRRRDPHAAQRIEDALNAFAQRLHAESQSHSDAAEYLVGLRAFLAKREAELSGAPERTFAALSAEIPAWLEIVANPVHGCFDQLRNLLNTYEHEIEKADQTFRNIEDILWKAIDRPEQLDVHVDWSGNPFADAAGDVVNWGAESLDPTIQALVDFLRAHEGEIRGLIDNVRRGVEYILLLPIDGLRLQRLIDHLEGLRNAYEHHIRSPFIPLTQSLLADFTPSPTQMGYHNTVASVPRQQTQTAEAFGALIGNLHQLRTHNETATISQVSAGGGTCACLVMFGALVAFPPDFEITIPSMAELVSSIVAAVGELLEALAAIAAVFVEIGAFIVGIPLWAWEITVLATAAAWEWHEVQQSLAATSSGGVTLTPGERGRLTQDAWDEVAKELGKLGKIMDDLIKIVGTEELVRKILELLTCMGYGAEQIAALLTSLVTNATINTAYSLPASAQAAGAEVTSSDTLLDLFKKLLRANATGDASTFRSLSRVIKAVVDIGPQNIKGLDVAFEYLSPPNGEADIIDNNGDVYEIGGSDKVDKFGGQDISLKRFIDDGGTGNPNGDIHLWMDGDQKVLDDAKRWYETGQKAPGDPRPNNPYDKWINDPRFKKPKDVTRKTPPAWQCGDYTVGSSPVPAPVPGPGQTP